jgi:hypothetical protein
VRHWTLCGSTVPQAEHVENGNVSLMWQRHGKP